MLPMQLYTPWKKTAHAVPYCKTQRFFFALRLCLANWWILPVSGRAKCVKFLGHISLFCMLCVCNMYLCDTLFAYLYGSVSVMNRLYLAACMLCDNFGRKPEWQSHHTVKQSIVIEIVSHLNVWQESYTIAITQHAMYDMYYMHHCMILVLSM